jgi:hypothetical protein
MILLEERMKQNKQKFPVLFLSLFLAFSVTVSGSLQTEETESSVPELFALHEIIYPLWHSAYPEKDFDALRNFTAEINAHAEKINNAKLPGILRDKETKWKAGLEELNKAVEEYNRAATEKNNQALLNAAEALHSAFEKLVRTIRPVLKEVDDFHKVLYVVYHKYLPNQQFDEITSASTDLLLKAEAITKAALPSRLESKTESFAAASQELYQASKILADACLSGDKEAVEQAVDNLHSKYQYLEKIFD